VDTLWVTQCLWKFAPAVAQCSGGSRLSFNELEHGALYDEDEMREDVSPNIFGKPCFFLQQLPLLHNLLIDDDLDGVRTASSPATKWFLDHFERFFRTCKVTIHLVFICICWIRSIAAMQRDGGLGRTASVAVTKRRDLVEQPNEMLAHGSPLLNDS
jgi:hypothetical protein